MTRPDLHSWPRTTVTHTHERAIAHWLAGRITWRAMMSLLGGR